MMLMMQPPILQRLGNGFWLVNGLGLCMAALGLKLFWPVGGVLDHQLIQPWVAADGTFPLRQDWWLTHVSHGHVKHLIIAVIIIWLVQFLGSFYKASWRSLRWTTGYMLLAVLLSTSLIGILKAHSVHACPWNLTQPASNGFIWLSHLDKPGKCFPGGHAATGFALLAAFFALWLQRQRLAWFYLLAALVLGMGMGWTQMMRGAHFFSHNLWTLWFSWLVNVLLLAGYALYVGIRNRQAQLLPAASASGSMTVTANPPSVAD
jgi:membrane-associated PAP2 superfamily phosphatase